MTKKDYVAIARAIKGISLPPPIVETPDKEGYVVGLGAAFRYGIDSVALVLCDVFARDNGRFDRARFLAACGVKS